MRSSSKGTHWKIRRDLSGAYPQCAVHQDSSDFAYILVSVPGQNKSVCFPDEGVTFWQRQICAFFSESCWQFVGDCSIRIFGSMDKLVRWFRDLCWFAGAGFSRWLQNLVIKLPHSTVMFVLGVSSGVVHGWWILIDNTPARKLEISSLMSSVLEDGRLPRADALRHRGRLQFASGQLFGRLAKKALSIVAGHAYSSGNSFLAESTIDTLKLYLFCLGSQRPREVRQKASEVWFGCTDACYELAFVQCWSTHLASWRNSSQFLW